jgi:uncharacterized protein YcbX
MKYVDQNRTSHSDTIEVLVNTKRLWRYPVKSMLGEPCNTLKINYRGVEGDRLFAIKDHKGKFGSGKNTRRFRHINGLLTFQAWYQENIPIIQFPDGLVMRGDEPTIHTKLSEVLEQQVTLAKENKISHFDDSPIHIVTSAALTWLQETLPNSAINESRFRPNLFLDVAGNTPVEHQWIGKRVQIGNEVTLEITKLAERCVMTSSQQKDLPHDPQIFQHIIRKSNLMLGVYAKVVNGGTVNLNDEVKIYH